MKKIVLILLILTFILPVTGKDKCNIFASPLGAYTLPWSDQNGEYIVYFNKDGSLNEERVNDIAHHISWQGGNSVREFPFWINSEDAWRKLRPFTINPVPPDFEYFYIYVSDSYEWNWSKIARIYNQYGVKLWFSLFDHCSLRNNKYNPWTIAYGKKAFYSEKAEEARYKFIDAMIRAFKGKNVGFEICNEPRLPFCTPEFLAYTFAYLIKKGVQPENIIIGIQYDMKERFPKYSKLCRDSRKLVVKELGKKWEQWLKSRSISPCHNMTLSNLKIMLGENPPAGGTRNLLLSMDGWRAPRPSKAQVKEVFSYALKAKSKAARNGKINFEVVYGKQRGDPLDSILGISEIYKDFFGNWPDNYHKYELVPITTEPQEPEPVEPIVKPVPVKIPPVSNDESKNNKTWIYVILAGVAAAAVFLFVKHTTITVLALAVLLLLTSYIGYKKKWKHYYVYLIVSYCLFLAAGILTNNQIIMKALFCGSMLVILIFSLIVDRQNKKIKKCKIKFDKMSYTADMNTGLDFDTGVKKWQK
jgi:hypothetical protein